MRRARASFDAALVWVMGLAVAAYSGGLFLQGGVSHPVVDLWLSLSTSWLPAGVCWLAVARVGFRRWEVLLAALAMTSFAAGDTYYAPLTTDWSSSFPSVGDLGYMLFYLLMLAKLTTLVRRDARGQSSSVWLDCAVGSLGAAAVLVVVLDPVLTSALTGSWSLATAVANDHEPVRAEVSTGSSTTTSTAAAPSDPTAQSSHTDDDCPRASRRTSVVSLASISR